MGLEIATLQAIGLDAAEVLRQRRTAAGGPLGFEAEGLRIPDRRHGHPIVRHASGSQRRRNRGAVDANRLRGRDEASVIALDAEFEYLTAAHLEGIRATADHVH